jgi:hypothetical protein
MTVKYTLPEFYQNPAKILPQNAEFVHFMSNLLMPKTWKDGGFAK